MNDYEKMKENLHYVERPDEWTQENLEKFMVFCILDTQMDYDKVCSCYEALEEFGAVTKNDIRDLPGEVIKDILQDAGHRFYNQKARYIKAFAESDIDLANAERKELTKIKGVGMKLASMFLVRTRGMELAIIDVHIKRWLEERDLWHKNYEQAEKNFVAEAVKLGMSVKELDIKIWEERRRGANN